MRYDPSVEAHHDAGPTVGGWLGRKFVYGTGGADLAARHGNKLAPAVLTPTYAVAAAALLIRGRRSFPLAAIALASGTRSLRASPSQRLRRTPSQSNRTAWPALGPCARNRP